MTFSRLCINNAPRPYRNGADMVLKSIPPPLHTISGISGYPFASTSLMWSMTTS